MREFFGIGGYQRTPEGFLSWQHLVFVSSATVIMIGLAALLGLKRRRSGLKAKNRVLAVTAILFDVLEISRIVFLCFRNNDPLDWLHNLPLFLCTISLISLPLAAFSKGRLQEAALDFVFIFGMLGGILGNYGAGQNFSVYPVLGFDNVASCIMHSITGFSSFYIGFAGMASMKKKNIWLTFCILLGFCGAAYIANITIPYNYMFLMRGDGTPYDIFYNLVNGHPVFYPLTVVALFLLYITVFYTVFYMIRKRKDKKMKKADIIILAGQSNAVGVGHIVCLPKHFSEEQIEKWRSGFDNIKINYYSHDKKSGGFVKTSFGCTEVTKDTMGPEVGIADALDARYPGKEIFIVKCAYGGSSLYCDWLSPSCGDGYDPGAYADQKENIITDYWTGDPIRPGWAYNELVKILGDSIKTLEDQGYSPEVKAFCWMQGEADACFIEQTEQYLRRYNAMITDLQSCFGGYFDDCVFIDAGVSEIWPKYAELNAYKKDYADKHKNCVFIDTVAAGLTTANEPFDEPDTYHYDTDCVIKLGHMFAEHIKM